MNDKLRTAIYGFAVGDAFGVPYEFCARGVYVEEDMTDGGVWSQPKGTWSDDTALLLATCDAIRKDGGKIKRKSVLNNLKDCIEGKYYINNRVFDVGTTTLQALKKGAGLCSEHNCGNGSLMRILPLAFIRNGLFHTGTISSITHAHPLCIYACKRYLRMVRELCARPDNAKNIIYDYGLHVVNQHVDNIKSTGYVVDTLNSVLWCLYHTNSYKLAVMQAVKLGGDTDTIAALTGACAALIYGIDSIPQNWMEDLKGKDIIERSLF